jgi:hypothetical protein
MSNSRMPSRGQTWAQTSHPIPSLMPQKSNAAVALATCFGLPST